MRRETFKFWDFVQLILETLQYMTYIGMRVWHGNILWQPYTCIRLPDLCTTDLKQYYLLHRKLFIKTVLWWLMLLKIIFSQPFTTFSYKTVTMITFIFLWVSEFDQYRLMNAFINTVWKMANLRDMIAVRGLVILPKLDPNHLFCLLCDFKIWCIYQYCLKQGKLRDLIAVTGLVILPKSDPN